MQVIELPCRCSRCSVVCICVCESLRQCIYTVHVSKCSCMTPCMATRQKYIVNCVVIFGHDGLTKYTNCYFSSGSTSCLDRTFVLDYTRSHI